MRLIKSQHENFPSTLTLCLRFDKKFLIRSVSFKVTDFGTNRKLIYDFLLVINTNLPPILHRFRCIAFDRSKITIFGYPSCVYNSTQTEGFPSTISVKFSVDVNGWQGTKRRRNVAENFDRLSRVHERYRETRDDRRTGDSKYRT